MMIAVTQLAAHRVLFKEILRTYFGAEEGTNTPRMTREYSLQHCLFELKLEKTCVSRLNSNKLVATIEEVIHPIEIRPAR